MPELTITVTINYDDADDLRKIADLLSGADKELSDRAMIEVERHTNQRELLDKALPHIERSAKYIELMRHEFEQEQAWIQARNKASHIVYGAFWRVTTTLHKVLGRKD